MKKIGFFVNSLIKAGPVNVVYDIIAHIDREIYEPVIFVLRKQVEFRSLFDKFSSLNIKIFFLNFSFLQMESRAFFCAGIIEQKLEEEGITDVHAHSYNAAVILSKCKKNIRKIITFHNICAEDFPRQKGLLLGNCMVLRYLNAIRKFDDKIGISDIVSDFYRKKIKDYSIVTIYNGIDCEKFFKPTLNQRENIRKKFGLTDETVYVIIGTLSKRKNVIHIIDTIKKVKDEKKFFYFVGTGPLLKKCKQIAADCKNIIFTGYQMDIRDYLAIADFSIAASKSEGFGLAALEVVVSGITLIYSDCKAFQELFSGNEVMKHYMFSLDDKNSLLIKINELNKIDNFESIISTYREKFDSKVMSKKYQQIYKGK